jgi:hypothetical protein
LVNWERFEVVATSGSAGLDIGLSPDKWAEFRIGVEVAEFEWGTEIGNETVVEGKVDDCRGWTAKGKTFPSNTTSREI